MSNNPSKSTVDVGSQTARPSTLDGQGLKRLAEAGLNWLKTNQQVVNALNVFPVPDGDTGTNMLLTMQAAYAEIANSGEKNVGKMAHGLAQGALMGARGNSGVILSQLWRGFARGLDSLDTLDTKALAVALAESRNTAYKGVVRPVEGTILTVAKDLSIEAQLAAEQTTDLVEMLERIINAADESVRRTPELLPILRQAGVVDSGGKGLFIILEGMLRYIKGEALDTPTAIVQPLSALQLDDSMQEVEPGQDFEVVIDFRPNSDFNLDLFYHNLTTMGTSIQVGEGDGMYRMHIHVPTEKRYEPIDYTMGLGTITKVFIENLMAQMEELGEQAAPAFQLAHVEPEQIAVIAVSPGSGISRIFASLGAAGIVEGGQTMNPSTEEILKSFEDLPTNNIIILPNNKNIVMAAQTASTLSTKNVKVIPCTSVPQGLAAIFRLNPDGEIDKVAEEMTDAIADVLTGEITTATRTVELNGVDVHEGEVIALLNGKLVASANSIDEACFFLLDKAQTQDHDQITMFYGDSIARGEVDRIVADIQEKYPDQEIEVHEGGQPHYHFILSIE